LHRFPISMIVSLEGPSCRCSRLGWWLTAGALIAPLVFWSRGRVLYDGAYLAGLSHPWFSLAGALLLLSGFYRLLSGTPRHPRGWGALLLRLGFLPAWWVVLLSVWLQFIWADLGRTRFALALLLLPLVALWYGLYAVSAPARLHRRTAALVFTLLTGALVALAPALVERAPLLALALALVGLLLPLGILLLARRRIAAAVGHPGPILARGVLLGFAFLWFPLVLRADNGCLGVSTSYESTLLVTTLLLFGFGPGIFDLLDPGLTPENHRLLGQLHGVRVPETQR
jgi:hypothetical protein